MKPISLKMSAFGPYAKVETIDFDLLEKQSLFLITGPTGAGKTTIFDAICFALFGKTNGMDRPENSVRSDQAAPDLLTEVIFEFELRGKRYRVQRNPKQLKPKSRGEGFTEHASDATLYFETLQKPITGANAVTLAIEALMGLKINQFRQIMMIPQGEFRMLLMSSSSDRSEILKHLFKTYAYGDLQNRVSDEKNKLNQAMKEETLSRKGHIQNIKVFNLERMDPLDSNAIFTQPILKDKVIIIDLAEELSHHIESANGPKVLEIGRPYQDALRALRLALKNELDFKREAKEKMSVELERQSQHNERHRCYLSELENQVALKSKRADIQNTEEEIAHLQKLVRVKPLVEAEASLEVKFNNALKMQLETESTTEKLKLEYDKAEVDWNALNLDSYTEEDQKLISQRDILTNRIEKFRLYSEAFRAYASQKEVLDQNQNELEGLLKDTDEIKVKQGDNETAIEVLQEVPLKLTTLEFNIKNTTLKFNLYHSLEQTFKKWLETEEKLTALKETKVRTAQALVEAKQTFDTMKIHYHLNQAARIAEQLTDGGACPVCGSIEHPFKATFNSNLKRISDEDLIAYEGLIESAISKDQNADKAQSECNMALQNIRESAIDNMMQLELHHFGDLTELTLNELKQISARNLDLLKLSHDQLVREEEGLKQSVQKLERLQLELKTLKLELGRRQLQSTELQKNVDAIKKECTALETQMEMLKHDLPDEQVDEDGLKRDLKILNATVDERNMRKKQSKINFDQISESYNKALRDASRALGLRTEAERQWQEGKENLRIGLESESLSLEIYNRELGNISSIPEKTLSVKVYHENVLENETRLKALIDQNAMQPAFELEVTSLAINGLTELISQLEGIHLEINQVYENNQTQIFEIDKINQKTEKLEAEYFEVGHLSDLLNGNNQKNITFERYILSAYLNTILTHANLRLRDMTNGRYTLKIAEEVSDGRKSAGLDLEVVDHYTGMPRSVKTLSGGESFKASLALALSLSEVVQQSSGGIQLDTVFIDEGFGTLDQESLESAIECLILLRDSGRLVGIISHVEALKERIKAQLQVVTTESGSYTQFKF